MNNLELSVRQNAQFLTLVLQNTAQTFDCLLFTVLMCFYFRISNLIAIWW
ncbi:hypothetical protein SAMN04489864_101425 [Pedobacter insulae]|uniref:Uncharacterized protein n=1 Tax=Pedobacter insulae TaxID=414048 RepID=A0A1I2THY5_9SPHI|nr:hypothetical protein SAMN04489864_101425 [Pedobacter insulae]